MVQIRFVVVLSCAILVSGVSSGAVWYVGGAGADDGNAGTQDAPFATIQRGVDAAAKNDTILIAAGTYLLEEAVEFKGKDVELKGATGNAADVIVDGQGKCPCIKNCTYDGKNPQVIVSSLTVQNGFSSEESGIAGGITSQNMALITNCVVRNCYHGVSGMKCTGGGMYLAEGKSDPTRYSSNWPAGRQFRATIADTLVEDCAAVATDTAKYNVSGGGVYSVCFNSFGLTVRNCAITNDTPAAGLSETLGGGAYLSGGTHSNCVFIGNRIMNRASNAGYLGNGGGLYLVGSSDRPVALCDSLVSGNSTHGAGGGVGLGNYAVLSGCTIVSNTISHGVSHGLYQPGGVGVFANGSYSCIENSLIAENVAVTNAENKSISAGAIGASDAFNLTIRDCVIRDNLLQNAGALSCISAGGLLVTNCVMCGNCVSGEVSAVRFYTNQSDLEKAAPSIITDCFIVSNRMVRPTALLNGGGLIAYGGDQAGKGYYAAPLIVRNCLFAGNRGKNGCRGWGVRVNVADTALSVDGKENALLFDHCTFVTNFNESNYSQFVAHQKARGATNTTFTGCVFYGNRYSNGGSKLAGFYDGDFTCLKSYSDKTDNVFTVTEENGNLTGEGVNFVDPENFDFRLQPSSILIDKGGAFADWMGTGSRQSTRDMGGGYVIGSVGKYGVTVSRPDSNPRRYGAASDIGCCEFGRFRGIILLVY